MRQQRFNLKKFQTRWEAEKKNLDEHFEKWEDRKKSDTGRAILVKSGRLKRSVRAEPGSNFQKIEIASDVPYSKYYNEGTTKLPKRKFIGMSKVLNIKIKSSIRKTLNRIFS